MRKKKDKKQPKPAQKIKILANYEAARTDRRTEGWFAQSTGPNNTLRRDWQTLVRRSQDLADNDGLAKRATGVIVNNWIGDGIMSVPVGATKKYQNSWNEWNKIPETDFYEVFNNYGNQSLGARTAVVRGAYLLRKRINPDLLEKYGVAPLQLQIMEAEWLDWSKDNGQDILFGQQFDQSGRLLGYWVRDQHPNETFMGLGLKITSTFVPKDEMVLIFDCQRPAQRMGLPFGTAAILSLRDIGDIKVAQQLKDKIAACFFGVSYGPDDIAPNLGDPNEHVENARMFDTIEPGAVEHLPPGRSFQAFQPPGAGDFPQTEKVYARTVASAYEITYESLTGDLSNVNFSSFRGGWLEFHRRIAHLRWNVFIPRHCARVCAWHDELSRMAGLLRGQAKWEHTPPRREMIDPPREMNALIDAIKAGVTSLSEVQRSLGFIPENVINELADDMARAREKGLILSIDGASNNKALPPVESQPQPVEP